MNSELERRWPLVGFQTSKIFLEGFLRLLETSENNLHSATYDNSEIWFRRLDGHERTLSTLLNRIEQTNHGVPRVDDLTRDLRTLLSHTSNLRSHYESRFFLSLERDSDEHLPTIVSNSLNRRDQGAGPGRLRVHVTREQLQSLNEDAGFTWSEISKTLGISQRTLRRRRHELGMRVEGKEFSSLSDSELDDIIRQILSAGLSDSSIRSLCTTSLRCLTAP